MNDMRTLRDGWVLQFCHGYSGPFLDCARQYAVLFKDTPYRVCTVYLTGEPKEDVVSGSASDEVIFLNLSSREIRGLKLKAIAALRKIAESRDFRFCIAHRFKPTYVALLGTSLPVIGIQHAFGVFKRRSRQGFARFFRERLMLLGVSNAVRDDVRACLPSWPHERIQTLYNRIDVEAVQEQQIARDQARDFLGIPQGAWVVGNVGRLHPDKDQATLIRGFAKALPNLPTSSMLLIMGTGRLEKDLKSLVVELGVEERVCFAGQVANGRRYFKAFDVFVLSSDHEPFGMVLLEAMAARNMLLCTNCGGAPEVVGTGGELFAMGDEVALATALLNCAAKSEQQIVSLWNESRERLASEFSDEAAKRRFWSLPIVQSYKIVE